MYRNQVNRMARIVVLVPITAVILLFLGVFGLFRRCCVNRAFTLVAFAAYSLSPVLVAYMLGLMQSAPFKVSHFPFLATYLVVVIGSTDSYTAHSIWDIERWKSFNVDSASKCFMTSWMIASYMDNSRTAILCTVFLFIILFMELDERARALMLASNSVMQKNFNDTDPFTMLKCKYLVIVADEAKEHSLCSTEDFQKLSEKDEVITVEKVWNCKGMLLSESGRDRDGRLKDLCLFFSLFQFICLRFNGYSLPQEAHKKLWRLIIHMLSEEKGYERVFRVIKVELAFLFDLLFTKYPVNLNPHRSKYRLLQLAVVVGAALISFYYLECPLTRGCGCFNSPLIPGGNLLVPALATILLMISILLVELAQFVIMIFSEWAKVIHICKYVQDERCRKNRYAEKLIEIMCRVRLLKPWGRQLRRYSLLKSYNYSPWKCINNRLTAAYVDPKRNGQDQIAPTNLSEQVIKVIAQSLMMYDTSNLKKGQASLILNDMFNQLSWACPITFCEHEAPLRDTQLSKEPGEHFGIATKLSKYLAYLVAFTPRLLPDHPYRTQSIFRSAVSEARGLFKESSVSMDKKIEMLKGIDVEQCQENIVLQGIKLGRQFASVAANEEQIWKVLADFWEEMMLYMAPSNAAAAHVDYLPTGGEFVTHVWVFVSHAGIKREPHDGERRDDSERN
ncbi:hypothetical protein EUGRSUZ_D00361 [Eucalyptus grandis]|uniref:DUF4220 domain-containing protein n=1 Tax=Eucalyptus grandis TaxID=71139 RepID=A0A059CCW9_EUCGR|nr:hypothetical protein EUGRSUZ_D00361 [Eucalyptus grandis]